MCQCRKVGLSTLCQGFIPRLRYVRCLAYSSSPDDDMDKMGDLLERKEVRRMKVHFDLLATPHE